MDSLDCRASQAVCYSGYTLSSPHPATRVSSTDKHRLGNHLKNAIMLTSKIIFHGLQPINLNMLQAIVIFPVFSEGNAGQTDGSGVYAVNARGV